MSCVSAYTVSGCVSAALAGALCGAVGKWLEVARWPFSPFSVLAALALLLAARELGVIHFGLPERKRQSEKVWANRFGLLGASWMWGFHIGLAFVTRITYGGFYVLALAVVVIGDPWYGALLFTIYWIGRALPVWSAPLLLWLSRDRQEMPAIIAYNPRLFRPLAAATLLWLAVLLVWSAR